MTRVDELQKKYPTIPRQILIKADVLTCGLRESDAFHKLGHWHRSAAATYQTYDHDISRKERADTTPTETKPGYLKRLDAFYLKGAWAVRIERDSTSPYEIRETGSGKYGLFEGDEKVEDTYFPPQNLKPWPYLTREEPLTSAGKPISTLVNLRGPNCAGVAPLRHCEYFTTGEQCKFCNYNPTQEDARAVGAIRSVTIPLEETLEAYRILSSEVKIAEMTFISGGFTNVEREAKLYSGFIEKMAVAASYKPHLSLVAQPPKSRRELQRWKDSGLDSAGFDIEVWDPELFVKICPGKAKHVGRERYLEAMLEAADIFGDGKTACLLVLGATLLHPDGHKTWQESRDVLIEATQWLAKNGVLPYHSQLRWAPGSEFSKDPANRSKLPPTEHHLDLLVAQEVAMKEYRLYEKMNRFAKCALCCGDHYITYDLTIFELSGGNLGNWMAPVIPDEINWVARIAEWIDEEETVKAQ